MQFYFFSYLLNKIKKTIIKKTLSNLISPVKKLPNFALSILLLVSFCSLFFIENHSLIAHDESAYANRAKLILETNNWFTPFETAHHKTIGSYWLTALSFKIFGINEFSARLPSYVFSISSAYLLFRIIKLFSGLEIGILSIFTLFSSYLWFGYGNYCSPDTFYIFCNLLGISNLINITSFSAEKAATPMSPGWSFKGFFGTFDRASLQRGYQVYTEVCASCHSMKYLSYRNLAEKGGQEF